MKFAQLSKPKLALRVVNNKWKFTGSSQSLEWRWSVSKKPASFLRVAGERSYSAYCPEKFISMA